MDFDNLSSDSSSSSSSSESNSSYDSIDAENYANEVAFVTDTSIMATNKLSYKTLAIMHQSLSQGGEPGKDPIVIKMFRDELKAKTDEEAQKMVDEAVKKILNAATSIATGPRGEKDKQDHEENKESEIIPLKNVLGADGLDSEDMFEDSDDGGNSMSSKH